VKQKLVPMRSRWQVIRAPVPVELRTRFVMPLTGRIY
jgi:hypothetical protein